MKRATETSIPFTPHPYQYIATQHVLDKPASGLFLEMGLGKTVATLSAMVELMHNRFDVGRPLVIAPLRVASTTWPDEITKWEHTQHLTVARILETPIQRKAALSQRSDVWLINLVDVPLLVKTLCGRCP